MEIWLPPEVLANGRARWQELADRAAFDGGFCRAWSGGWAYANRELLVLTAAEHQMLAEASAALARIIWRVTTWVQENPVLLPVLGIAPSLTPWAQQKPGCLPTQYARLDWAQDARGRWWCLECNADTPGGLPEATVWQRLVLADLEALSGGAFMDPNRALPDLLGEMLRAALPGVAGFVAAPGQAEDWENVCAAALARGGEWVAGGLPEVVGAEVRVAGVPVDALYRFYPGDWLVRHPALLVRLSQGFPVLNPGTALIAQSKALFALLWHLVDEGQYLTPAERDWVRSCLPRTALTPLAGAWVAKPYWEREGGGIVVGAGEGPSAAEYVYQERIDITRLPCPTHSPRGTEVRQGAPVVGVYLVAGQPAGYLSRIGGAITDHAAHMLPTAVWKA